MKISALISDVDGTLVTPAKTVTDASRKAVAELRERGISFAVVSSRPPRGMQMLVEPFGLTAPLAGFNGGAFTNPDLSPLEEHALSPDAAQRTVDMLRERGIDIWVFSGLDWYVRDIDGPHVAREMHAVRFEPTVVDALEPLLASAFKIVGVSDDHALLERCEAELRPALGEAASASRSQPYYLDVTHPMATKGIAVTRLAALMGVPLQEIAVIGDAHNDISMFAQSGLSIAMGNAPLDVQKHARFVTSANDQEGFAKAVRTYILDA